MHGAGSKFLRAALDRRTVVGRVYEARRQELVCHIGEPTTAEAELIDQGVRLSILGDLAWADLELRGFFTEDGQPSPAVEVFRKASADQRSLLQLLGIDRRIRNVNATNYDYKRLSGQELEQLVKLLQRIQVIDGQDEDR